MSASNKTHQHKLFATMWGVWDPFSGSDLGETLDRVKAHGYHGIEMPVAFAVKYGSSAFLSLLQSKDMLYIAGVFSSGPAPTPALCGIESQQAGIVHLPDSKETHDVERHELVFEAQLREAAFFQPILHSVTCHTGKDYFTPAEADRLLSFCTRISAQLGLAELVHHETHRSRILYSPWVAREVLARHPNLTLVADLSHYTCVAEASPDDAELNEVVLNVINPRVRHIHARVGYEQGPQVPDPRGPRWQPYLASFKRWWGDIYAKSVQRGDSVISSTPEFGPPPYCWTTLLDDKPIADMVCFTV